MRKKNSTSSSKSNVTASVKSSPAKRRGRKQSKVQASAASVETATAVKVNPANASEARAKKRLSRETHAQMRMEKLAKDKAKKTLRRRRTVAKTDTVVKEKTVGKVNNAGKVTKKAKAIKAIKPIKAIKTIKTIKQRKTCAETCLAKFTSILKDAGYTVLKAGKGTGQYQDFKLKCDKCGEIFTKKRYMLNYYLRRGVEFCPQCIITKNNLEHQAKEKAAKNAKPEVKAKAQVKAQVKANAKPRGTFPKNMKKTKLNQMIYRLKKTGITFIKIEKDCKDSNRQLIRLKCDKCGNEFVRTRRVVNWYLIRNRSVCPNCGNEAKEKTSAKASAQNPEKNLKPAVDIAKDIVKDNEKVIETIKKVKEIAAPIKETVKENIVKVQPIASQGLSMAKDVIKSYLSDKIDMTLGMLEEKLEDAGLEIIQKDKIEDVAKQAIRGRIMKIRNAKKMSRWMADFLKLLKKNNLTLIGINKNGGNKSVHLKCNKCGKEFLCGKSTVHACTKRGDEVCPNCRKKHVVKFML